MRAAPLLFLCFLLSACYATGLAFTEAPKPTGNDPVVYMYRPEGAYGGAVRCGVFANGERVAAVAQNGFTWFHLPPGTHAIGAAWGLFASTPNVKINVPMREGGKYYFRISSEPIPGGTRVSIRSVPEAVALKELESFKYEAPSKTSSAAGEKASADPSTPKTP